MSSSGACQAALLHLLVVLALLSNNNSHAESITQIKGLPINMNPLTVLVPRKGSPWSPALSLAQPQTNSPTRQQAMQPLQTKQHTKEEERKQEQEQAVALALLTPAEIRAHELFLRALPSMSPAYVASISDIFAKRKDTSDIFAKRKETPARSGSLQIVPKLLQVTVVHSKDTAVGTCTWNPVVSRVQVQVPEMETTEAEATIDARAIRPLQLKVQAHNRVNRASSSSPLQAAVRSSPVPVPVEAHVSSSSSSSFLFSLRGACAGMLTAAKALALSVALYASVIFGLVQWAECEIMNMIGLCEATASGAVFAAERIRSVSVSGGTALIAYAPCVAQRCMDFIASVWSAEAVAVTPPNTVVAKEETHVSVAQATPVVASPQAPPPQASQPQVQPAAVTDVIMHSHSADVEEKVSLLENAALGMMRAGNALEAANVLQEGIDYLCRLGKEMHVDVAALRHLLVKCRLSLGEAKAAESLLRKVLTVYAYACGGCTSSDSYTAQALEDMSHALALQGRRIEARIAAAKAAEIRQVLDEVQLEEEAAAAAHKNAFPKDLSVNSSKTPERTVTVSAAAFGSGQSPAQFTHSTSPASKQGESVTDIFDLDALEKTLKCAVFDIAPAGAGASVKQALHEVRVAPNSHFKSPCRTASPFKINSNSASSRVSQNASSPTRSRRVA